MQKSKNRSLFNKLLKKIRSLKKEKGFSEISSALKSGKNTYMRLDRLESSNFDMVWIKRIEDCIYDLGEIVSNPREVTKVVTSIVPVELAKKTGSESVMHLASHTQYIKDITPEGDVVPNKILNIGADEDIHTYENRFIATLIRRLVLFIEKRYEFVKKFAPLHDEEILYFKNKSIVDGAEVEIETKIKVRSESSTKMADTSNKYIDRILKIREYVLFFYGSKFMKELKTERDVRNPIMMTNILRKNPKYHKCYELYRFIEKYDRLGVSYKVNEDISNFGEEEMSEMNAVMISNYLALKSKNVKKPLKSTNKEYKPRILTSLDDEEFIYGDLLKGPIEFMRVDEGYKQYLESQIRKDLPLHPTKLEKEYYAEEYQEKKDIKEQEVQIEKLEKRKKKAESEFDKKAQAMVALREKEEQERIEREKEAKRLEEEKRLDEIRRQLIEDAKANQPEEEPAPVEEAPQEEVPAEEPVVQEQPAEEVQPEPVIEEQQPAEEPQPEPAPVVEEPQPEEPAPVEEAPIEEPQEQPVEEQPVLVENPEAEEVVQVVAEEAPVEEAQPEEQPQEEIPVVVEEVPVEEPVSEPEPVVEEPAQEPEPQSEPVPEQPKKRKSKIVWVTFTDSNGKTHKVPQHIYDDEEVPVVKAAPVVKEPQPVAEPEPVVEEKVEEPVPEPQPEPAPVEQPKKKKSKFVWITFTDSHGNKKKVPQKIYYDEEGQEITEQPAPTQEPQPEPEPAPVVEEPAQEPEPEVQPEEPVEEAPIEDPVEEVIPEPAPEEPEPIEEPQEEEPVQEEVQPEPQPEPEPEPVKEEIPEPVEKEEKPQKAPEKARSAEKSNKKPEKAKPQKEEKPRKERKLKEDEDLGPKLDAIPGRFIVKTLHGYYVGKDKFSVFKQDAWVFSDYSKADRIRNIHGGKVVKL